MSHCKWILAFNLCFFLAVSVVCKATAQDEIYPRTIQHDAGKVVLEHKPLRIVSTSPSLTGILLSIEAPLIASAATTPSSVSDDKGFFTQWAAVADERKVAVLYNNLEFNLEAILSFQPDLVIGSVSGADSILPYYDELQSQGLPTLVVNYSNKSWQELATELAEACGLQKQAQQTLERFDIIMHKAAAQISVPQTPVTIVGYNLSGTYSIGTLDSPQAKILQGLGFHVSDLPPGMVKGDKQKTDFKMVSHENLPMAITGETVFLMRGSDDDVSTFKADPVLRNLTAVKNNQVYPLGIKSFRIDYYSALDIINTLVKIYHNDDR